MAPGLREAVALAAMLYEPRGVYRVAVETAGRLGRGELASLMDAVYKMIARDDCIYCRDLERRALILSLRYGSHRGSLELLAETLELAPGLEEYRRLLEEAAQRIPRLARYYAALHAALAVLALRPGSGLDAVSLLSSEAAEDARNALEGLEPGHERAPRYLRLLARYAAALRDDPPAAYIYARDALLAAPGHARPVLEDVIACLLLSARDKRLWLDTLSRAAEMHDAVRLPVLYSRLLVMLAGDVDAPRETLRRCAREACEELAGRRVTARAAFHLAPAAAYATAALRGDRRHRGRCLLARAWTRAAEALRAVREKQLAFIYALEAVEAPNALPPGAYAAMVVASTVIELRSGAAAVEPCSACPRKCIQGASRHGSPGEALESLGVLAACRAWPGAEPPGTDSLVFYADPVEGRLLVGGEEAGAGLTLGEAEMYYVVARTLETVRALRQL